MKKKQVETKRLVLAKERIRQLDGIRLTDVNGGCTSTQDSCACGSGTRLD